MSMPLAAEIESVGPVWCGRGSENSARAGRRIESIRPSIKPSHDTLDVDEAITVESTTERSAARLRTISFCVRVLVSSWTTSHLWSDAVMSGRSDHVPESLDDGP